MKRANQMQGFLIERANQMRDFQLNQPINCGNFQWNVPSCYEMAPVACSLVLCRRERHVVP